MSELPESVEQAMNLVLESARTCAALGVKYEQWNRTTKEDLRTAILDAMEARPLVGPDVVVVGREDLKWAVAVLSNEDLGLDPDHGTTVRLRAALTTTGSAE